MGNCLTRKDSRTPEERTVAKIAESCLDMLEGWGFAAFYADYYICDKDLWGHHRMFGKDFEKGPRNELFKKVLGMLTPGIHAGYKEAKHPIIRDAPVYKGEYYKRMKGRTELQRYIIIQFVHHIMTHLLNPDETIKISVKGFLGNGYGIHPRLPLYKRDDKVKVEAFIKDWLRHESGAQIKQDTHNEVEKAFLSIKLGLKVVSIIERTDVSAFVSAAIKQYHINQAAIKGDRGRLFDSIEKSKAGEAADQDNLEAEKEAGLRVN